jgi:hypothetical protein
MMIILIGLVMLLILVLGFIADCNAEPLKAAVIKIEPEINIEQYIDLALEFATIERLKNGELS